MKYERERNLRDMKKNQRKRIVLALVCVFLCVWSAPAFAAETTAQAWICPSCGAEAEGNFCSICGAKKDEERETITEIPIVNGNVPIELTVDFVENLAFSKYNVKMFLDNVYIATLPHGKPYHGFLGVSSGLHVLTFQKENNEHIVGIAQFRIESSTSYHCRIQTKRNKITIDAERLGGASLNPAYISPEDYMAMCQVPDYQAIQRYPDQNKGLKIKVSGKVFQVEDGLFNSQTLQLKDKNGKYWIVTYTRTGGEARVLVNDSIIVYGECSGMKTIYSLLSNSVAYPAVAARYIILE